MTAGRRATGYVVESLDSSVCFKLPELVECNNIPNNRDEIPSPAVAEKYSHLQDIAAYIPPHDEHADIELLIGLDLIEAFYVLEDRVGKPYAERLPLGWVMFGSDFSSSSGSAWTLACGWKTWYSQRRRRRRRFVSPSNHLT